MRIGKHLKSAVGKGTAYADKFMDETFKQCALTEEEVNTPWLYKERIAQKMVNAQAIDIMDLWEHCFGSVKQTVFEESDWRKTQNLIHSASLNKTIRATLTEAETMAGAFQLLTQAKLFTTMMAVYNLTPKVSDKLFGTFSSPYEIYDHQIPSDAPIVEYIHEGEEYKERTLQDRFCQTRAFKFGARVSLTRETMISDRTGQVVQQCEGLAKSASYREDELAALAWQDASNSTIVIAGTTQQFVTDQNVADAGAYYPERTQAALYRTTAGATSGVRAGGFYETSINQVAGSNDLTQWDNIVQAIILLKHMTNPRSKQLIDVIGNSPLKLVVPVALEARARQLTSPGTMNYIASPGNQNASGMIRVPDGIQKLYAPFGGGPGAIEVEVWNKLPDATVPSQSTWYLSGDSTQQFRFHQRWASEFMQASQPQLGGDDFKRDVILSVRGGFAKGARAVDDKYCIKSTH